MLKVVLINMVAILMMSAKLATLGLLKIKVFSKKNYDVIIYTYDISNQLADNLVDKVNKVSRQLSEVFDNIISKL